MADTSTTIVISAQDATGPAVASAKANAKSLGDQYTATAKQTAAAMRGLPAQMTDVVVSLQGGQNPLTVLLQQGGQVKDMFGGIGAAAKGMGNFLLGLVTPYTAVAAGLATLAVAAYQGNRQLEAVSNALVATGNYAGTSTSQVMAMAAAMGQANGKQSEAAEVLTALISTGRIAGDQMELIARAAMGMSSTTGRSVKEIVADFVKLGDEPVKASAELNKQSHYLTQAIYEQIKALEDQGDRAGAAALAQRTYAQANLETTAKIRENMGNLARSMQWVEGIAKSMWQAIVGWGRDKTGGEQLAGLKSLLAEREQRGPVNEGARDAHERGNAKLREQIALLERLNSQTDANAKRDATRTRDEEVAIAATGSVAAIQDRAKGVSAVTRELKKYRDELEAIRRVNPTSELLDPKAVKAGEDAIRKQYAGAKGSKKLPDESPIEARLQRLQGERQEEERGLRESNARLKANYEIGLITAREYLDRQFEAKNNALAAELDIARKQEEIASGKRNVAAAERYRNDIKRITDEMTANWAQHSTDVEVLTKRVENAVNAYRATLANAYTTRGQALDDELAGAGIGPYQLAELRRQTDLRRDVDRRRSELARDLAKGEGNGGISKVQYDQQLAELDAFQARRLQQELDFNAKAQALRQNWAVGAQGAVATYIEQAEDMAGGMNRVWGNALQGSEDALVQFATTGKLTVKGLVNSILADMARLQARSSIKSLLEGGGSGGGFGWVGSLLGALTGSGAAAGLGAATAADVAAAGPGLMFLSGGGYTGPGGKYEPAGIVHRGEVVWSQADVRRVGGVAAAEALRLRGYSEGGAVGMPSVSAPQRGRAAAGGGAGLVTFAPVTSIQIDSRSDRAAVMADVQDVVRRNNEAQLEHLKRNKVLPS